MSDHSALRLMHDLIKSMDARLQRLEKAATADDPRPRMVAFYEKPTDAMPYYAVRVNGSRSDAQAIKTAYEILPPTLSDFVRNEKYIPRIVEVLQDLDILPD